MLDPQLVRVVECLADAVIGECFGRAIGGSGYYRTSCGAGDDFGAEVVDGHAIPFERSLVGLHDAAPRCISALFRSGTLHSLRVAPLEVRYYFLHTHRNI